MVIIEVVQRGQFWDVVFTGRTVGPTVLSTHTSKQAADREIRAQKRYLAPLFD